MRVIVTVKNIESVMKFVSICEKYKNMNIDVKSGKYTVDGKSIMGVMSLNLSAPLNVDAHGSTSEEYSAFINDLSVNGMFSKAKTA